ncbi:MAG TPA: DNA double-strand break repair nuclease NurA [Anaerolineales bacterium]|nr:DNA double-strand break repair nuclease NurA [Anaerolineales bacterium]
MSLDLPQLLSQVNELSVYSARKAEAAAAALPAARAALTAASRMEAADLERRIRAAGPHWRGARPTDEPLDQVFPLPAHPDRLHVIGADGSQIYPDRHGAAFFFLVNIGSLHLEHGSGQTPIAATRPRLFFAEEDLHEASGALVDTGLVNARRDLAEMEELARLVHTCERGPCLALLDNGLLLWLASQEHHGPRPEVRRILEEYLSRMDDLRKHGAALAGLISRPRSVNLLALLHVAAMEESSVTPETAQRLPFAGLTDQRLMADHLPIGARSARTILTSPLNREFAARGHEVQAFYLNTGGDIARVEVPAWVGEDPQAMARVHAGLVEQCRVTGVPYVLVRAHELAVVRQPDRQALDDLLAASLAHHGLLPMTSQKARTKKWTASRRRHVVG